MLGLCWIPLIAVGLTGSITTDWHPGETFLTPKAEAHTCMDGLGVQAEAVPDAGLYSGGLEYVIPVGLGEFKEKSVDLLLDLQAGLSGRTDYYQYLPMGIQFQLGAQAWLCWGNLCGGVDYDHFSDAGLKETPRRPNWGVDKWGVSLGWRFL